MITDEELKALNKFQSGNDVDDNETELLERAALIGLVSFGMTFREGNVIRQARLTTKGKAYIEETDLVFMP